MIAAITNALIWQSAIASTGFAYVLLQYSKQRVWHRASYFTAGNSRTRYEWLYHCWEEEWLYSDSKTPDLTRTYDWVSDWVFDDA